MRYAKFLTVDVICISLRGCNDNFHSPTIRNVTGRSLCHVRTRGLRRHAARCGTDRMAECMNKK